MGMDTVPGLERSPNAAGVDCDCPLRRKSMKIFPLRFEGPDFAANRCGMVRGHVLDHGLSEGLAAS